MSKKTTQYDVVRSKPGEWRVQGNNNERASSIHSTQKAATEHAKVLATNKGAEVAIHGVNGPIRAKHTYGKPDPHPPKG